MKKSFFILFLISVGSIAGFSQTEWKIDRVHSTILFKVKHMVISKVVGKFNKFEGVLKASNDDFDGAEVEVKIDVNSINTENGKRDTHLKSEEFFDAANYPEITFKSTSFKKTGENDYEITGDFTIRDKTNKVSFVGTLGGIIKDPWGNTRVGWEATTTINRFDFGLTYDSKLEVGGLVVGKEVTISLNLELIKQ